MQSGKQPSPSPTPSPAACPAPFSPQPTRVGINVHPAGSPEPHMPRVLSSNDLSKISRMVESSSSHTNSDIINSTKREPLNIIIPMGGIGARFAEQGYRFPKPLVNVVGRPMLFFILDNLNFQPGDKLWLAVRNTIETQFRLCERVRTEFSSQVEVSPVILEFDTRGAAETLTVVLQSMSDEELSRKTISLDCDTVYFSDVLGSFRNLPPNVNATYYFEDQGTAPIYSYVRLVKDSGAEQKSPHGTVLHPDQVVEVKEKVAISCHANTGAYAFASAALLRDYCFKLLHQGVGKEGEYYTSRVIALMLQNNEVFHGILMPSFACLGTPRQLKEFFESVAHGKVQFKRKVRVCFDLDSTLVTNPTVPGDYTTCRPIDHNIRLAQALHKAGHVIIIHTARRMKTCKGNVGAVVKNVGMVTLKQLDDLQIPYDEIYFGKPYADLYVDDLSVNALLDTEKELGWLEDERRAAIQQKHQLQMVNARSFNHLQIQGGIVRKTSSFEAIDGEAFYYQHLPQDVGRLFPKVIDLIHTAANETTPATTTLVLEQIIGVPFSLLICNYCVDPDRLVVLLTALKSLHSSTSAAEFAKTQGPVPLYANYGPKIQSRYKANQAFYEALTLDGTDSKLAERCLKQLMEKSEDYEKNKRAICVPAIHGDPVFSNALLTNNEEIKFLDMRGKLGNMLTLQGDVHYDLAKVYQSLCGYDIIMHGYEVMCAPRQRFLRNLRQVFAKFVEKNYPQVRMSDVEWICASLWFSLLPLHLPTASDEVSRDVQEGKLREYFRQACILLGVHQPSI